MATIFADSPITDENYSGTLLTFPDETTWFAYTPPPIVVTFHNQTLTGSLATTAYGDLEDINMVATATSNLSPSGPFVYLDLIAGYTFNMGNDKLSFGDANNTLYGDMRDLNNTIIAATSNNVSLTNAGIDYNTFNFGLDSITAGNGNNTVYGDARDFNFNIQGPINPYGLLDTVAGNGASDYLEDQAYNFAKDTIVLGNGNNVVYGDMRDFSVNILAGTGSPQEIGNFTIVGAYSDNTTTFASNLITVGDGNNTIYGNFRDWSIFGDGGTINGTMINGTMGSVFETDTNAEFAANTFTSANSNAHSTNNIISIGDGNNTIFANGENLSITMLGGHLNGADSTLAIIDSDSFAFGNDVVKTASGHIADGNNTVYGDLENMILSVVGGDNVDGYVGADAQIRASTYVMGNDSITLGNGNNKVFGDMNDVSWTSQGGLNSVNNDFGFDRLVSLTGNHLTMGNDNISVGNGNNTLYGDAHNINLEALGGTADMFNSPGALTFRAIGGSNVIDFGNDTITAGTGNNTISGDAWDVNLEGVGGSASNGHYAWGRVNAADIHFGDDVITVGNKSEAISQSNTIYGDAYSFTMDSVGGTVDSTGGLAEGQVINNTVEFGNNIITAAGGSDKLYANVEYLNLIFQDGTNNAVDALSSAHAVMTGNTINFGNSTLVGGTGNNAFYGDAAFVSGLNKFLANGNTVTWSSHNVYTGGSGHNDFHFTIFDQGGLVTEGNTEITNFGAGHNDKLVFDAPANVTLASLNAAVTETYVGKSTILTFHDGSHITLDNFHLAVLNATNTVIVH